MSETDGPIGLILVPTRELAEQISAVVRSFFSGFGVNHLCITGGQSEWHQKKTLFIDLVNQKYVSLNRVTYVVLDEADRMVSMGFEQQIRSLLSVIRPDVQLVLFSATFPPRIVQMAVDLMESPVRVAVGKTGMANKQIQQEIYVLKVRLMDSSHV